jgi:hypothetical protein
MRMCPILSHTWLKIFPAEAVHRTALCFHSDIRVTFHHGARDMSS